MKKCLALVAPVALALLFAPVAQAIPITYTASLSGLNEAPPNASPGTGFAVVTVDDDLDVMTVDVTFSGLIGTTTASHIHCCTAVPGTGNAGVATQVPNFAGFPLGVTAGSYFNTFDLSLLSTYNPSFVTANGGTVAGAEAAFLAGLASGQSYFNIHTSEFQGGEIRGFLTPVPEPASLILLASGLVGVGARRWRAGRRARD